jgi:DNA polymerase elongation subunit (family B)
MAPAVATNLLTLAGLVAVRRRDIGIQQNFNRAVLNLVLDARLEKELAENKAEAKNEDAP